MAGISKEVSRGATTLAVNRVQELLRNRGVDPTPISNNVQDTIITGMIDDEEENRIYDGENDFYDILESGSEEEVDNALSEQAHRERIETPIGYPSGRPIQVDYFKEFINRQEMNKSARERAINNAGMNTGFTNLNMQRQAAQSNKRNYDDFVFGESSFEICGRSKKCTEIAFNLNFKSKDEDDLESNMEKLSDAITFEVVKNFPRIHSIAVADNYLIVNDTCFVPNILDNGAKFPLDTINYIKNGCIAPFINWRKLFRHSRNSCVTLSIDSSEFYLTYVGDSLEIGRKIGVSTAFKVLNNLNMFYLEGESVTREDLNSPESSRVKKKLASKKRSFHILDGYKLDVCKGTQGLQDFTFNSLKDYATNRGNKGFIRYAFGTVARLGLATVGGTLNLGSHLVRGVYRGGKELVKNALTPVEDEDIYL